MKTFSSAILAALLALILFGCGPNSAAPTNAPEVQPNETEGKRLPQADSFRVAVNGRGMVRLDYETLARAADVSALKTATLNLYYADKAVPILVEDDGDGKFDPGDAIIFYSGQQNPRSDTDVFFLRPVKGEKKPLRYTPVNAATPNTQNKQKTVSPLTKVIVPLRFGHPDGTPEPTFYANDREIRPGSQVLLTESIADYLYDLTPFCKIRATMRFTLDLREEAVSKGVKHNVKVTVNKQVVPHKLRRSGTRWQIECNVTLNNHRNNKTNEIYIENVTRVPGGDRDLFVPATVGIESGFLTFSSRPVAIDGRALIETDKPAANPIHVTNFSSQQIRVFAPEAGKVLQNISVAPVKKKFEAVFNPSGASMFAAVEEGAFLAASSVEAYEIETRHTEFISRPDLLAPKNEADYIIIAPRAFLPEVQPLLRLRKSQTIDGKPMQARAVAVEDIYDQFDHGRFGPKAILDFLQYTQRKWKRGPRYVVLAADATRDTDFIAPGRTIPCGLYRTCRSGLVGSDNFYALPDAKGRPQIAVGRLPADSADELKAMVRKIVEYETSASIGSWQRRMQIFAGTAGYGTDIDTLLEKMFNVIFGNLMPRKFDLNIAYAGKGLEYYYPIEKFREHVIESINEGALFAAYVGHGAVEGLDRIRQGEKAYSIFEADDAAKLKSNRRQSIMLLITCSSGAYDLYGRDCLAEALEKSAGGPVAVIAGSAETHPYANGIIGIEMLPAFFAEDNQTTARKPIGDSFIALKRRCVSGGGTLRFMLNLAAVQSMGMQKADFERLILDHQYLYNLVGDPAMLPAVPGEVSLKAPTAKIQPGKTLTVTGECPDIKTGSATVTLECDITASLYPPYVFKDKSVEEYVERNRRANDKIAVTIVVNIEDGKFIAPIKIPATLPKTSAALPPGTYFVKVFAQSGKECAFGALKIEVESPKPQGE